MTYDEFKKKMIELERACSIAWRENDMETTEDIERSMLKLKKEHSEFKKRLMKEIEESEMMWEFGLKYEVVFLK